MMKISFRPLPGLTAVCGVALAILISLGTWQYHRLQWKTELLADIETAVTASPLTSLWDVQNAIEDEIPVDFRRIGLQANPVEMDAPFFVFTAVNRNISWRPYIVVENNSVLAFAATEVISDQEKSNWVNRISDSQFLAGYVRQARPENKPKTESSPKKNRWFGFNPLPETHDWGELVSGEVDMRFYIDTVPGATNADALPIRRPNIRNNHFDYMLTWYGLAIVLVIIYVILHRREGRLTWR